MSNLFQRFVSRLLVGYGCLLPSHPGKWRVAATIIAALRLQGLHEQAVTVRRKGAWFSLDTTYYIDRTIYYLNNWEATDTTFLLKAIRPGWVLCDIGANIGWFAILAATAMRGTGRVYAFEPAEEELSRLLENVQLNRLTNLVIYQRALSNQTGELWLTETRDAGTTRLVTSKDTVRRRVLATTLDAFAEEVGLKRLDFVKVDIEGAEVLFLEGAQRALRRFRPALMVELCPENLSAFGTTCEALIERITDLRYDGYRSTRAGLRPLSGSPRAGSFFNGIFLPR